VSEAGNMDDAILDDTRVIELDTGIAVPVAGLLLSEAGAEVIRIEAPRGDSGQESTLFAVLNRGKGRLALDLPGEPDWATVRRLLVGAGRAPGNPLGIPARSAPAAGIVRYESAARTPDRVPRRRDSARRAFLPNGVGRRLYRDAVAAARTLCERFGVALTHGHVHGRYLAVSGRGRSGADRPCRFRQAGRIPAASGAALAAAPRALRRLCRLARSRRLARRSWLAANLPSSFTPGLLHGDYHFSNVMFRHDRPELAAIVDWELSTLGDPLLDLARLVATWPDASGQGAGTIRIQPVEGLTPAEELVARYGVRSRRDLSAFHWYLVLARFKLGIMLEASHARSCAGLAPRHLGERHHGCAV
jgi:Phosphotransferase enzyme family/CoA-transferase family III